MTTIKATCHHCGADPVELTPADVMLILSATGDDYTFVCPECDMKVSRPANERMVSALLAVGCSYKNVKGQITETEIKEFVRQLKAL